MSSGNQPPAPSGYRYSDWVWSEFHKRYYCALYDENDVIVEYQYEGGFRQVVNSAQQVTAIPTTQVSPSDLSRTPRNPQYDEAQQAWRGQITSTSASTRSIAAQPESSHTGSQRNYTSTPHPSSSRRHSQQPHTSSQPSQGQQYPSQGQHYPSPQDTAELPTVIQDTVGGNKSRRHITSTNDERNFEKLEPSYKRIASHSWNNFFIPGRVFKMLWTEPAGQLNPGKSRGSSHFSVVYLNENAYSEIRRFVVIRNKNNFSQCIPIQTYREQGATKANLIVRDHAIIYTGGVGDPAPTRFAGEEEMITTPLRIRAKGNEYLTPASRINFGKPYAVEHNVKVVEIGMVADEHLHLLDMYFIRAFHATG